MLNLVLADKKELLMSYMPFVANGGVFIPTDKKYEVGVEVFVVINIKEEKTKIPVPARVVWLNYNNNTARKTGIGLQFAASDKGISRNKIEKILAGILNSDIKTYTI